MTIGPSVRRSDARPVRRSSGASVGPLARLASVASVAYRSLSLANRREVRSSGPAKTPHPRSYGRQAEGKEDADQHQRVARGCGVGEWGWGGVRSGGDVFFIRPSPLPGRTPTRKHSRCRPGALEKLGPDPGSDALSLSLSFSLFLSLFLSQIWPAGEAGQRGPKARARRGPEGPEPSCKLTF